MAKLTTNKRKSLPKSDFGLPGSRKYPIPDKNHARNALARASEMEHKGRLSKAQAAKIDHKADKVLGVKEGSKRDQRMDSKLGINKKSRITGNTKVFAD